MSQQCLFEGSKTLNLNNISAVRHAALLLCAKRSAAVLPHGYFQEPAMHVHVQLLLPFTTVCLFVC